MAETWFDLAFQAVEDFDVPALRGLLGADERDLNRQDELGGFSLLHLAVDIELEAHNNLGHPLVPTLTRILLDAGVDLGLRTHRGQTASDMARERGYIEAAELLRHG